MEAARTITTPMLRDVIRSFCADGKTVSNAQLYDVLELKCEKEKDRVRTRANDMIRQGELIRRGPGLYEYNFKYRLRENTTFPKIYRFIRMETGSWSYNKVCQITRVSYTQVARFCSWLEDEGYIARSGKDGATQLYRKTAKADREPETPFPPTRDTDPFEKEKAAAAKIARLMLCHDPYSAKFAREICESCNVLRARFDKNVQTN